MAKTVSYGLSNLYYAPIIDGEYMTPLALSGAVNINLSPELNSIAFTGLDGIPQEQASILYGYNGSFVVAALTSDFCRYIYKDSVDEEGTLTEIVGQQFNNAALLYEVSGSVHTRRCFYNCTFGKPEIAAETTSNTVNVATITVPITIRTNKNGKLQKQNSNINSNAYKSWFDLVV